MTQYSYNIITKMLKKDELKVLKLLLSDMTKEVTITDISKALKQNYFQTYRKISELTATENVSIKTIGKSKIVQLDYTKYNPHYIIAEVERMQDARVNKEIYLIQKQIIELHKNFICILFGSQVITPKKESDIDLLFIIPDNANYVLTEKAIKMQLAPYHCDINVIHEKNLLEMWANPKKLNLGNEILKKHIVLYGTEHFMNMLRHHYVG